MWPIYRMEVKGIMADRTNSKVPLSFACIPTTYKKLKKKAKMDRISLSQVINMILQKAIEEDSNFNKI